MMYFTIGVDPSGNYAEGKGTTGIAVLDPNGNVVEVLDISAKDHSSMLLYWSGVIEYINTLRLYFKENYRADIALSIEDYILYGHKANDQINSKLETSKLIGAILYWAHNNDIPCYMRTASVAKPRWTDDILIHKGYMTEDGCIPSHPNIKVPHHAKDALRHAVHCYTFELGKSAKEVR